MQTKTFSLHVLQNRTITCCVARFNFHNVHQESSTTAKLSSQFGKSEPITKSTSLSTQIDRGMKFSFFVSDEEKWSKVFDRNQNFLCCP